MLTLKSPPEFRHCKFEIFSMCCFYSSQFLCVHSNIVREQSTLIWVCDFEPLKKSTTYSPETLKKQICPRIKPIENSWIAGNSTPFSEILTLFNMPSYILLALAGSNNNMKSSSHIGICRCTWEMLNHVLLRAGWPAREFVCSCSFLHELCACCLISSLIIYHTSQPAQLSKGRERKSLQGSNYGS